MDDFDAYQMYMAIRTHYTSNYDYFKYHGKMRLKRETFESRRDKYFFKKLSRRQDLEAFLFIVLKDDPSKWIGHLMNDEYEELYISKKKIFDSMTYNFRTEMSQFESLEDALNNVGVGIKILSYVGQGKVSEETLAILNKILNDQPFQYWESNHAVNNVVWERKFEILRKYVLFLKPDISKYNKILLDIFN